MRTTYLNGYAITSFTSSRDLYAFMSKPNGLRLLDVDYLRLFIKWSF